MTLSFDLREPTPARLIHLANAPLPTRYGIFETHVFSWESAEIEASLGLSNQHVALVMGEVTGRRHVPVRVHSECMTSEVFGSLKCDCK
ncbi:MAG TPA: hypothetical protein VKP30_31090, partial [Polyangiaceae bacterium]|nr:hypothetical protein [Polyangiaceae bacterium]